VLPVGSIAIEGVSRNAASTLRAEPAPLSQTGVDHGLAVSWIHQVRSDRARACLVWVDRHHDRTAILQNEGLGCRDPT
jgi:hypothetical protein